MRYSEEDPCGGEHRNDDNIPTEVNLEEEEEDDPSIISHHFFELSSMLPNLPEDGIIDQGSIIRRTIEHIQQLQNETNLLNEQVARNNAIGNTSGQGENDENDDDDNQGIPLVKFMSSGDNVLINIHCKKDKDEDNLAKIIEEINNFGLSIVNMCSLPFGDNRVDITLITLVPSGFTAELKNLVTTIKGLLLLGNKMNSMIQEPHNYD